jgi:hypothetical protein
MGAPAAPSRAANASADIPSWLRSYVGDSEGKITRVVLERARSLYLRKVKEGAVKNACYFAMDATRPNISADNLPAARFYVICEGERSFRAIPSGHGSGRNIKGVADFSNGRECAKNFGNALDSFLTTGGAYVTAETRTSFKGYYQISAKDSSALVRAFVQFEGEGETANARQRDIGGHAAVVLKGICLRKFPQSPYADERGYVPFGRLEEYSGGRSDGCTSWSRPDADQIVQLLKDGPTTLYIYPESHDIEAVAARRSPSSSGPYWNAACLKQIGSPKFWPKELLEPILARERQQQPETPPRPPPLCEEPSSSGQ